MEDYHRYTVTMNDEMYKKIEDFHYNNRYPSRNTATIELIRLGLESYEKKLEQQREDQ